MLDEYAMNRETGELKPCTQVIREFYKTHGALEAWTDEWEPTGMLRYRMRFGDAESRVIIAALVAAGARFC